MEALKVYVKIFGEKSYKYIQNVPFYPKKTLLPLKTEFPPHLKKEKKNSCLP